MWINEQTKWILKFKIHVFALLFPHLVNACWLNFFDFFFIGNYIVSAFKCRVACPLTMFCYGEKIQNIKLILKQNYEFSMKIQMMKNVHFRNFANFGQHLLPICWWYGQVGFGGLQVSIWSPFISIIMVWNAIFISGGRKNHFFVPVPGCWNNYLQINIQKP